MSILFVIRLCFFVRPKVNNNIYIRKFLNVSCYSCGSVRHTKLIKNCMAHGYFLDKNKCSYFNYSHSHYECTNCSVSWLTNLSNNYVPKKFYTH